MFCKSLGSQIAPHFSFWISSQKSQGIPALNYAKMFKYWNLKKECVFFVFSCVLGQRMKIFLFAVFKSKSYGLFCHAALNNILCQWPPVSPFYISRLFNCHGLDSKSAFHPLPSTKKVKQNLCLSLTVLTKKYNKNSPTVSIIHTYLLLKLLDERCDGNFFLCLCYNFSLPLFIKKPTPSPKRQKHKNMRTDSRCRGSMWVKLWYICHFSCV